MISDLALKSSQGRNVSKSISSPLASAAASKKMAWKAGFSSKPSLKRSSPSFPPMSPAPSLRGIVDKSGRMLYEV